MFGKNLKEIRTSKHITQIELSEMIGVSQQQLSNYEKSKGYPSVDVLLKLCKILDCSPNKLLGF